MAHRLRTRQNWRVAAHPARRGAATTRIGVHEISCEPSAETTVAARQRLALLTEALTELSPQTQRVFRMHKFEGLSHPEVAATIGISRSAVEKHMMAALKHLLARLP